MRLRKNCALLIKKMSVHDSFNILEQIKIINEIETCFREFINFWYSLNLCHWQHCSEIYLTQCRQCFRSSQFHFFTTFSKSFTSKIIVFHSVLVAYAILVPTLYRNHRKTRLHDFRQHWTNEWKFYLFR